MNSDFQFTSLIGEEVGSIAFVRNYIELHFNGPVLRCLANPEVHDNSHTISFPEPGSRDAFCELIGEVVTEAEDNDHNLVIRFGSKEVIIPKSSKEAGPEIAHLLPSADRAADMIIWENLIPSKALA